MAAMLKKLLAVVAAALITVGGYAMAVELREDHPDEYVVKKGDTLWSIAGRFLNEPWLWPEIWQANPQIENPHLIYPGDVISLAYLGGRPTLKVTKLSPQVRRDPLTAIPAVPLADIEPFLKKTRVIDKETLEGLPYVLALEEDRLRATSQQVAYVRGGDFRPGQEYAIVRPTVRFAVHPHPVTEYPRLKRDPYTRADGLQPQTSGIEWAYWAAQDNGFEVLGYEVIELTTGTVTRGGDPATVLLADQGMEVKNGDLLMPVDRRPFDLSFQPRAPKSVPADMRVLAHTDRLLYGGPKDVVALSAGARDGVENGQVYGIYRPGERVRDDVEHKYRIAADRERNKVKLPDEFVGHVMIFRTFDKMSYGLVMDGIRPVRLEDRLRQPVAL